MSGRGRALGWGQGGSLLSQGPVSTGDLRRDQQEQGCGDPRSMQFRDLSQLRCRGQQWKDRCGSDKPWALMREGAGVNSELPWRSLGGVHGVPELPSSPGLLHTRGVNSHAPFSSRARATRQSPLSVGPGLGIKRASGEQSAGAGGFALQTCSCFFPFPARSRDSAW